MAKNIQRSGRKSFGKSASNAAFRGFNAKAAAANMMSRTDFLRVAGISAGALTAAMAGLSGIAKAEGEPPSPPTEKEIFCTLAAIVDTVVPGVEGVPIMILKIADTQNLEPILEDDGQPVIMGTFGAQGTDTLGAAGHVPLGMPSETFGFVPPAYPFMYSFLPAFAGPGIVEQFVGLVNLISTILKGQPFANLNYRDREYIYDKMDKPNELAPLIAPYLPPNVPVEVVVGGAKGLVVVSILLTAIIYNSELCNLMPDSAGRYVRNADNTWPIIPGSAWHQAGYPGPLIKETNYVSPYPSLNVTIKGSKVIFGGV